MILQEVRNDRIGIMKTIICSEYQKSSLYHHLFHESGAGGLTDLKLCSVSNLLSIDEEYEKDGIALKLSHLLKNSSSSFPIYRNMFSYSAFIRDVLDFSRQCALYGISAGDLPQNSASEKELSLLVKTALSMPLKEKTVFAERETLLHKAGGDGPLTCAVRCETDPFRNRFLEDLRTFCGMKDLSREKRIPSQMSFRYAASVRQEMESLAQEIIRIDRPCGIVLCSYSTQYPVLRQVFDRYGIPFSAVRSPVSLLIPKVYAALAHTALFKDADSLMEALRLQSFSVSCPDDLLNWLQETMTEPCAPSVKDRIVSDFFAVDRKNEAALEEKSAAFFQKINEELSLLLQAETVSDAMRAAYTVMRGSALLKRNAELQAALAIRRILSSTIPMVQNQEDAEFVLQDIQNLSAEEETGLCEFCQVTDLSHPIEPTDTIYLIGCSGSDYPGFPVRRGLFDEAYTARIPAFPSLEERHTLWNRSLQWIYESSFRLIASYAANDYQGREIQPAFEIESRFGNAMPWSIERIRPAERKPHCLSAETAQALYTHEDGTIHSSISRIERFFNCPFSWFAESGLKIREKKRSGLDPATIGNISHAFFEYEASTHSKDYANAADAELDSFLKPIMESLSAMYPHHCAEIRLSEERLKLAIRNSLRFLKTFEAASPAFSPCEEEYPFSYRITDHITLNGIVDRMDESSASIRVIDYKSSTHKLSESKIKAGLQLQLPSYMIISEAARNKPASGIYYMSFKPDSVKEPAGAFKTTNKADKGITDCSDPAVHAQAEQNTRRMCGWALGESTVPEDTYRTLFDPGSGQWDGKILREYILMLYEEFFHQCTGGLTAVDPVEGACTFCSLHSVCRYHGTGRKPIPPITADVSFKKGKAE